MMITYLKEHSANELVAELKRRMRRNEEKVKSKEQIESKKDR